MYFFFLKKVKDGNEEWGSDQVLLGEHLKKKSTAGFLSRHSMYYGTLYKLGNAFNCKQNPVLYKYFRFYSALEVRVHCPRPFQ